MNILLSVTNMTAANGGVTTHIVDLCKELCKRDHKIILLSDENDCDYQTSIEELKTFSNFRFIHCSMEGIQSNPKKLFVAVNRVSRIVKEERVEIIHTHSQSLCVVSALVKLRTGVPYIWTNHIDEMANPNLFRKILKVLHFPIISVSTDLKQMLVNDFGVRETRITVVNNGINPERFPPLSDREKLKLKEKFGCEDKYVIGLLARMSYGKGHMYLLEAVNKLQRENDIQNFKILIAGKLHDSEKGYLKKLQDYAVNHKIDMDFLGFQNPRDVFGVSDIAVLPSLYEGFPLTVLEALTMACPVIRSDTPGWMDTKDITLVFKKKHVEAFADCLSYAYHNSAVMKQMGQRGKETVLSRFTIKHQVDATIDVYIKYAKESERSKN